jgi:hypothetical protein
MEVLVEITGNSGYSGEKREHCLCAMLLILGFELVFRSRINLAYRYLDISNTFDCTTFEFRQIDLFLSW